MKTIIKCLFFLLATSASAQNWTLEELPSMLQKEYGLTLKKSINIERDILKEGRPLKSRADIYTFVLTAKQREKILPGLQEAFEEAGKQDPNCYGINTMNDLTGKESLRNLMIGDNPEQYIVIGKDYNNYVNVNFLDAEDSTKTHRYAYALEWRDGNKGATDVRYIVTYAKIPSATTTLADPNWPFLNLGQSKVRKGSPILFKGDARVQWDGKDYPVLSLDSLIRDAQQKAKDTKKLIEGLRHKYQSGNALVLWNDTLEHDTDPVTDVVIRLHQGQPITADDLLCNDNILLIFSLLKQQFLAGQNTEFNAISVYTLCKRAREYGFFSSDFPDVPNGKTELEQLKRDIAQMKANAATDTIRNYLQMAIAELDKIK